MIFRRPPSAYFGLFFALFQHHMASELLRTEALEECLFAYNALISGCVSGRGYDRAMGYLEDMVRLSQVLLVDFSLVFL